MPKRDLTVKDAMWPAADICVVAPDTLFKDTLEEMCRHKIGIACVVDEAGKLVGVMTDGDIRRMLLKTQKPWAALFADDVELHCHRKCTTVEPAHRLDDTVRMMEERRIWDLPVVAADGQLIGLLHLHPAIKAVMGL